MISYDAGTEIKINKANIYPTFSSIAYSMKKSGTFYIYANGIKNNRIKITDRLEKVGKPCSSTGWIDINDIIRSDNIKEEDR